MSDLIHAVRINEEIKSVLDASRQISIVAINAFLSARLAGERSRGFAVVSRELRALAGKFESAMAGLDDVISGLAADLAQSIRDRRQLAYFETAVALPDPHPCLWPALERIIAHHNGIDASITAGWQRLGREVAAVLRLAESGGVLARSAKIEAAHGGEMARGLTQVAEQIEGHIGDIVVRLRAIRTMTGERT